MVVFLFGLLDVILKFAEFIPRNMRMDQIFTPDMQRDFFVGKRDNLGNWLHLRKATKSHKKSGRSRSFILIVLSKNRNLAAKILAFRRN